MRPRTKPESNLLFRSLATGGAIELLQKIGEGKINTVDLRRESKLTRKQYYTRMSQLVKEGLLKKKSGVFDMTLFGRIVFKTIETQEKARGMSFRLRSLDLILEDKGMPDDVKEDMIRSLIPDKEIQGMIIK